MQFHFRSGRLRFKADSDPDSGMAIDTVRTTPDRDASQDAPTVSPRVIEVSDLPADHVSEYVRDSDRSEVYLERKGGETYLVA